MFSIVICNETVCGTSECVCVFVCVCVRTYTCSVMSYSANPRTVDCQIPAWNFSGKNTRVGCHFLFQGIFPTQGSNLCLLPSSTLAGGFFSTRATWEAHYWVWTWTWSRSVMSSSLRPHGLWPTRLLCPWDFPGNSTGVDCHFLLQGIFPTQGSNPGLLHRRQTLYHLSHQGSPKVV